MTNENTSKDIEEKLSKASKTISRISSAVGKKVIGQEALRKRFITAIVTEGHILLEGVPGLAKTLAIKTLAEVVDCQFSRVQFTPDLLPADLLGTEIFRPDKGDFIVRQGPVFANFVLADEINRAPAKVQSALLEIMQEKQVTIAGQTFKLPDLFLVLATQNPVEQEGTYPLPEAQVDRFIMKVKIDYPSKDEEFQMLNSIREINSSEPTKPIVDTNELIEMRKTCREIYVDERIKKYIVDIVSASRNPSDPELKNYIELGASPRASIALYECARAEALINGDSFVRPEYVKDVSEDVLRHRIMLGYEAEAEGVSSEDIIEKLVDSVQVP